ncbi:MAG: GDYXXLXY domain-containing protein [Marinicella sp.]
MSESKLWEQLEQVELVSGDQPESVGKGDATLWYVRVLQGFAGWLAAVFLLAFLGFGVAGLFDNGEALIVMGVVINISAHVFYKTKPDSDFFEQMVLAFSLTGQFLFAFGLFELSNFKMREWLVVVGLYQMLLAWLVNHYLHRFLCTWFAVIAFFWGFEWLVYTGVGSAIVSALFVWLWLEKTGWEAEKDFYEPIAYALGFSILTLNVQNVVWLYGLFHGRNGGLHWWMENAPTISTILNSAVLLYFVYRASQEQSINFATRTGKLVILTAVLLLFSAMPVIGLSSALLVLLVGFARQKLVLIIMGALALLGFFSWYYYSLHQTLLVKSVILIAIGVVLCVGYWLLRKTYQSSDSDVHEQQSVVVGQSSTTVQKIAVAVTLVICLVGVNHAIMQKENTLANGKSVFLELAPVDPRSIMQGDFMRLRFDVANKIRSSDVYKIDRKQSLDGYIVVDVADNGVGTYHAIYTGQTLNDNQVLMQFRSRHGRIQFATNAFFFQEGDAKLFDNARFGEFKVSDDGELLLKAMYDQDLNLLGENRLD